jgi:hypothetical protein
MTAAGHGFTKGWIGEPSAQSLWDKIDGQQTRNNRSPAIPSRPATTAITHHSQHHIHATALPIRAQTR